MQPLHFRLANPADIGLLTDFLKRASLPTDDLPTNLSSFVLAFDHGKLVGSAGVEVFGHVGLLRSVAVDDAYRNRQTGQQLVEWVLQKAGVQEIFLITTSADRYFERHGFVPIDRAAVPPAIAQTQQFRGLCPASAVVMKKSVTNGNSLIDSLHR